MPETLRQPEPTAPRSAPGQVSRVDSAEERLVLVASVVVGSVGAIAARPSPTGLAWWDIVLTGLFSAAVILSAAHAARVALIPIAIAATLLSGLTAWAALGAVSLIGSVVNLRAPRRVGMFNALIVAVALQPLMRVEPLLFWGLPSLATFAVTVPIIVSGYVKGETAWRRLVRRGAFVLALAVVIGVVAAILTGIRSRSQASTGVEAARSGLIAARSGDQEATLQQLELAQRALAKTNGVLTDPIAQVAGLVPVVAQHLRAGTVATAQGARVAAAARSAAGSADVRNLQVGAGQVDLGALTQSAAEIERTNLTLVEATESLGAIRADWLVPPLVDALNELLGELSEGLGDGLLAQDALTVVPRLLGAEREHRYLALLASPAESREAGGFVGAWALLSASGGRLELIEANRIQALQGRTTPMDGPGYSTWLRGYEPGRFPQNLTASPDPLTVLQIVRDVFPVLEGAPIDGVFYLDPIAISAFVEMLGPIDVPELGRTLTPEATREFLLRSQYTEFESNDDRKNFLVVLLERVFAQLLVSELPGPERLGALFGPSARAGNMFLTTVDPEANDFLREVFLLRDFPAPDGTDFLSIVQSNGAASKLDAYLTRDVRYGVNFDPGTGALTGTVTVSLTSSAPPGLPPIVTGYGNVINQGLKEGYHRLFMGIYTPHEITEVRVDGETTFYSPFEDLGYNRPAHQVEIPLGGTVVIEYDLAGNVPPGDYRVTVANQALTAPDEFRLSVTPAEGWALDEGQIDVEPTLAEDVTYVLPMSSG